MRSTMIHVFVLCTIQYRLTILSGTGTGVIISPMFRGLYMYLLLRGYDAAAEAR